MFEFTFEEWYWLVAIAILFGTIHHRFIVARELRRRRAAEAVKREKAAVLRVKKQRTTQYALRTEVVRTRYMVDAWLVRHPNATLRHPGAKVVLHWHISALRTFFEHEGCREDVCMVSTLKQYDDEYWRAVWRVYHHGNVRQLPPCPLEY